MLCVTLGDPYSVNVEILAPYLSELAESQVPAVLIGSRAIFDGQMDGLGIRMPAGIEFCDIGGLDVLPETMEPAERGQVAWAALQRLSEFKDEARAILTMPVDKSDLRKAGFPFDGQTEFVSSLFGVDSSASIMVLAGPKLKVGLVTNHVPVQKVSGLINQELVIGKAQAFRDVLRTTYGLADPRIAVTGLNPHCSDQGLFGTEEASTIEPAIAKLESLGNFVGPVPADTAFYQAYSGRFDGVLAMYHDQGLGPLKTVHFDEAINITGGLPVLRVSPDHGPARDLFGTGMASSRSVRTCLDVIKGSLEYTSIDRHTSDLNIAGASGVHRG